MLTERGLVLGGYIAAALLPLVLLPYVRQNRSNAGVTGMVTLIIGIFLWCISTGIVYYASTYEYSLAAANIRLFAVYLTVGGWLLIAFEYTGIGTSMRGAFALFIIPAGVVQAVAWGWPSMVWAGSTFDWGWEETTAAYTFHTVYNYLLTGLSLVLFAGDAISNRGLRRRQSLALFVSMLPPLFANALFQFGATPDIDGTPAGLVASVYILAWALFRADFLDIVPAGRRRAIEQLSDPIVTLDADGRVVDCNRATYTLFGADRSALGRHYQRFFNSTPAVADAIASIGTGQTELTLETNRSIHHFDISVTDIGSKTAGGRLVVLRDVTTLREREQVLKESEQELELLRQVFERTLRHNVRNDINVIQGYAEQLRSQTNGERAALAEQIVKTSTELADASEKARTVGRIVDRQGTPTQLDLCSSVERLVDDLRKEFPAVTFTINAPDELYAYANPTVQIGIRNIIENAAEHNKGNEQAVSIALRRDGGDAVVVVEDNGPGLPADEIGVIRNEEETALYHGSGVGMWVIYWIDETTTATVAFDSDETGTTVTIRMPRSAERAETDTAVPAE